MALTTDSPLHRQVARVRRRLFLQTLVRALVWSWVGALALSAVWFLLQPLLLQDAPVWLRWAVLGGAAVVATGVAVTIAVMRKPSSVQAALALDEQFRLKERVTTSLMLRPDEASSSAGAALLADANQRVDPLRVGDRFPVRVPWTALFVPAGAGVLVLLAFFYNPTFGQAQNTEKQVAASNAALKADIDKKMQQLQNNRAAKKPEETLKSAELKKIEADIDKVVSSPHETKDQVQEQIKHADDLLEEIKKQDKERADEARALKEQLQQMERAQKKEDLDKKQDGPAKDMEKALGQGDLQKAKDAADELAKKLDDDQKAKDEADQLQKKLDDGKDKLKPEEKQELQDELKKKQDEQMGKDDRKKLEKQLKDMKDEADELTRKNEDEEKKNEEDQKKLEDEAKKGEKSEDELQREKEQLKKNGDQLKQQQQDMKNLSQKLGQAQQAMKEGKDGQAAQQMKEAGQEMAKMDGQGERKALAQDQQQVQQVKKALSQALAKQDGQQGGNKPGDQPGAKPGSKGGDQGKGNGQGPSGPNQGGQGSGAREESADAKTGEVDTQVHSDPDENAKLQIVDHVPGPADRFKGAFKPADKVDEIRKAAQEGAAASERERLTDKETAEMARGFFEKMRPPDKDDKKPAPK